MYFKSFQSKSLSAIMIYIMVTFSACKKDIPPIFKGGHFHSENPVVLVAGYESNGTNNVAKYWINGKEIKLSDGTQNASANSIFATSNNLYIAGYDNGAVYWKNNQEIRLSVEGSASSVFVSGNDVYVAGSDGVHGVYWKNGSEVLLDQVNVNGVTVKSIFVSGNDVYAAGNDGHNAVYWKNGAEIFLTTYNSEFQGGTHANSIFVSGNNVFVVGDFSSSGSVFPQVEYWKNEVLIPVNPLNSFGKGNSVFVYGSDIYIAGIRESAPTYVANAAYWKNNNAVLLPLSEMNSTANSIFVSGNHVYVAGYEFAAGPVTYAVYWKDGVETKLTDGTYEAFATSIFVR